MHDPANKGKRRFQVQDRPTNFNVTKVYCGNKFIDLVSDSSLEPTFEKLPVVKFRCGRREEYPQLPEKGTKILLCIYTNPEVFYKALC